MQTEVDLGKEQYRAAGYKVKDCTCQTAFGKYITYRYLFANTWSFQAKVRAGILLDSKQYTIAQYRNMVE